eukprot:4157216-Pleurochrysis_carterae.AAC.2
MESVCNGQQSTWLAQARKRVSTDEKERANSRMRSSLLQSLIGHCEASKLRDTFGQKAHQVGRPCEVSRLRKHAKGVAHAHAKGARASEQEYAVA